MNKTLNNCFGSGVLVSENRITEANFSRKELVTAVASGKTRELRLEDNQPEGAQSGEALATAGERPCEDPLEPLPTTWHL